MFGVHGRRGGHPQSDAATRVLAKGLNQPVLGVVVGVDADDDVGMSTTTVEIAARPGGRTTAMATDRSDERDRAARLRDLRGDPPTDSANLTTRFRVAADDTRPAGVGRGNGGDPISPSRHTRRTAGVSSGPSATAAARTAASGVTRAPRP